MSDQAIFDFERDFAGSLRCIPMSVRLKLDLCGIKLSLRQWSRFTADDRRRLLDQPCEGPAEIAAFHDDLAALIRERTGEAAVGLAIDGSPPWDDASLVPPRLSEQAIRRGLAQPSPPQWAGLTRLQRYALFKLSGPGHDNDNLEPALREFGLVTVATA
jgi:hypothetical protein